MSCIDAAIIKALVEHIGGNPDDVVSGDGNNAIQVVWGRGKSDLITSLDHDVRTFTLPPGESITTGTCLKFYSKDGEKFDYFYCTYFNISANTGQYTFKILNGAEPYFTITIVRIDDICYCVDLDETDYVDIPDNKTTGVFKLTGGEVLANLVGIILKKMYPNTV